MKALLVTSEVTFVPGNYDDLVCGLAGCPEVGGLLVLKNASAGLWLKALGVCAMGAVRVGGTLLRNLAGPSAARRRAAYWRREKPVWATDTINGAEALAIIQAYGFDLVINARTRFIYRKKVLEAPRLGCVNIHHGLLPLQRGTMCDLWALYEGRPAGFTIHEMTAKVDAGPILAVVPVSGGDERDYPRYLRRAARTEVGAVRRLLGEVARAGRLTGLENRAPAGLAHRRNPSFAEVRAMRKRGLVL